MNLAPSRDEVRRFFIDAWKRRRAGLPQGNSETLAADIVAQHPEYHELLADDEAALGREWTPAGGQTNPFLHLSLHLAIAEQLSLDQPPGVAAAHAAILARQGEPHRALHEMLECLAEAMWTAQRRQGAPDSAAYLESLRRRA